LKLSPYITEFCNSTKNKVLKLFEYKIHGNLTINEKKALKQLCTHNSITIKNFCTHFNLGFVPLAVTPVLNVR